jgi:hypothetical protein
MKNNIHTHVDQCEQHQQHCDDTALENLIQQKLFSAIDASAHLDLQVFLAPGSKVHLRVIAVDDGLVMGIGLDGFKFDSPRAFLGEIVIRIASIIMIEQIN